ncbi:Di-haem cytochrome c peroxidase family [Nitrosococcus oceani AFC27]|nr:Di-haem cytochrome c peroxidase family [Nitrosococcus oceani AFC27]
MSANNLAYSGANYRLPLPATDSDFYDHGRPDPAKFQLGKFLFFDKILSGNQNISCATCHHPLAATGDGLSLSVGEGGRGLGITRNTGFGNEAIYERVPRNAPPLFNVGAKHMTVMFYDGRAEVDSLAPSGFNTPAGDELPIGVLENVLAAQAMFPVTSNSEMAGQPGENPIADAAEAGNLAGPGGVWEQLANRLKANEEYAQLFNQAFALTPEQITYAHAANAIAAFEAAAWRADHSPFDRYLRGDKEAMSRESIQGMSLFYGKAGCSQCHSGVFQTDMQYHAIAMPQIGPGKGDGAEGHEDFGRERVTHDPADRYKFRTPPLRNVALTGPWGHDGTYNTLEAVVRHHLDPVSSLLTYSCLREAQLPYREDLDFFDCLVQNDSAKVNLIAAANTLPTRELSDDEVKHLLAFLHALTDPISLDLRGDIPDRVPSNLTLVE